MKKMGLILTSAVLSAASLSASAGWEIKSAGGYNNMSVYVPSSESSIGDGKALLIVTHGCGQDANAYKSAKFEAPAEEMGYVVALPSAKNKVVLGCYPYGSDFSMQRSNELNSIIAMVDDLVADSSLGIDPKQVYITGLSSGGGFSVFAGCSAPDVFAGWADASGPTPNTSQNNAFGARASSPQVIASMCEGFAGAKKEYFDTQIMSSIGGTNEGMLCSDAVNFAKNHGAAMASIYGVSESGSSSLSNNATETIYSGKVDRASVVIVQGGSHAWHGGTGAGGSFVTGVSINYGEHIMNFFTENNMRVDDPEGEGEGEGEGEVEEGEGEVEEGEGEVEEGQVEDVACESVSGKASSFVDEGLLRAGEWFGYVYTGDNTVIYFDTDVTVYIGDDGKGYKADPGCTVEIEEGQQEEGQQEEGQQ
ncbi:MAG: hypothetical protein D6B27_03225, partial [Gammaproteobacteria bacterium]